jgi:hypothetical protein
MESDECGGVGADGVSVFLSNLCNLQAPWPTAKYCSKLEVMQKTHRLVVSKGARACGNMA